MRHLAAALVVLALLSACEAPTGPGDERAIVATDAHSYVATITPLSATTGYLNRYDYDVVVRVQNASAFPMVLDGCEGGWLWSVASGDLIPLDLEHAQDQVEFARLLCTEPEHILISPGGSRIHHIRLFGYSSDALFMSLFEQDLQIVLAAGGRPLRSAPFVLRTPELVP